MQTLSKSAHMHTTGYFNMEALQATKVLAHYENMFVKHALPNSNTTTRRRALEEVVQNRHREKYLRIILLLSCTLKIHPWSQDRLSFRNFVSAPNELISLPFSNQRGLSTFRKQLPKPLFCCTARKYSLALWVEPVIKLRWSWDTIPNIV